MAANYAPVVLKRLISVALMLRRLRGRINYFPQFNGNSDSPVAINKHLTMASSLCNYC